MMRISLLLLLLMLMLLLVVMLILRLMFSIMMLLLMKFFILVAILPKTVINTRARITATTVLIMLLLVSTTSIVAAIRSTISTAAFPLPLTTSTATATTTAAAGISAGVVFLAWICACNLSIFATTLDALVTVLVQTGKIRPETPVICRHDVWVRHGCESNGEIAQSGCMELVLVRLQIPQLRKLFPAAV